jgi:bile acid:Na+ symporter, BASS family
MGRRGVHHANRQPGQQLRCRGGCCRIGGIDLRAEKRSKTALMGVLEKAVPIATLVFVVSSMVAMGLGLKVAQITAPLRNLRLVSLSLLANFVLMPAAAVVLARVLRLDEPLGVGLLVLGVAAGAPFLPKLTQIAKGNLAFAVALMVLLMVITVGYLPLVLPVLLPGVSVNPAKIARSLVLLMLVPLAVALAVNAKLPAAAARAKPLFDRLSSLGLILVVVLLVVVNFNKVLSVFGTRAILAGLLFIAFGYAVGWALGGPAADTRPVLGLGTAQRNIAAALVVGGQSFSNPSVVVMVVVVAIVSLLILLPMSRLLARKAGRGSGG